MKKKKKEKASGDTVQNVEEHLPKKKLKKKAAPTVEAETSTPTPGELRRNSMPARDLKRVSKQPDIDSQSQSRHGTDQEIPTPDELWKRQQRIEKAVTVLAPKIDMIMKALKQGEEQAKKRAAQQQQFPEPPKQQEKGRFPISPGIIEKAIDVLTKAFASPEEPGLSSIIEKKLITKAVDDIIATVDNDRAVGAALRKHITKHGMKGIIKFGEAE